MAGNAIGVFKRKEKKYLLTPEEYDAFMNMAEGRLQKNKFFQSKISNIYYDTDDFRLINRSIEKPLYKEKLRIRTYLTENWNGSTFAEMKKKYNGIVYKRRFNSGYEDITAFLRTAAEDTPEKACTMLENSPKGKALTAADRQIAREIAWMAHRYALKPKLWIGYNRQSYTDAEDKELRITFDTDITYRTDRLDLALYEGTPLFDFPYYLMEIKTSRGAPPWLCRALSENGIYPYSFSKCGRTYADKIFSNTANDKILEE